MQGAGRAHQGFQVPTEAHQGLQVPTTPQKSLSAGVGFSDTLKTRTGAPSASVLCTGQLKA